MVNHKINTKKGWLFTKSGQSSDYLQHVGTKYSIEHMVHTRTRAYSPYLCIQLHSTSGGEGGW
jgi:hypothetical protein